MARKVLIIDDDPGVRRSLARLLASVGFEVSAAATTGEALAALDGQDIVVTDLHLPDAPGSLLVRKVRREHRSIRIAIWTGDPHGTESFEHGPKPDAILFKPGVDGLLAWLGTP